MTQLQRPLSRLCPLALAALPLGLLVGLTPLSPAHAEGAWYSGDLHLHSTYSDGDSPIEDVIAYAEEIGLDFLAVTDHDSSMGGTPSHWSDPSFLSDELTLLYGIEWTTGMGHANLWSDAPFAYDALWEANRAQDVELAIALAHEQGALFSPNHPSSYFCCAWEYGFSGQEDSIEIWNAPYRLPNLNDLSVDGLWHRLIMAGQRPTAVGGSDEHYVNGALSRYWTIGTPTTWVMADSNSATDILNAISAGHVAISYSPEGPRVSLQADADGDGRLEVQMGEALAAGSEARLVVSLETPSAARQGRVYPLSASQLKRLSQVPLSRQAVTQLIPALRKAKAGSLALVKLYRNGDAIRGLVVEGGNGQLEVRETPLDTGYYRAEALGIPEVVPLAHTVYGTLLSLSNPVYVE